MLVVPKFSVAWSTNQDQSSKLRDVTRRVKVAGR
jgi:hypothetical protein